MGMTMSEKILAKHAGLDSVKAGQLVTCELDMVLANDITAPPSIAKFEEIGRPVFDNTKIALVPDHFQPAKDIKSAELAKIVRDFARKYKIVNYFEQGRVGIEHVILPEKGIVAPGMLTIGATRIRARTVLSTASRRASARPTSARPWRRARRGSRCRRPSRST